MNAIFKSPMFTFLWLKNRDTSATSTAASQLYIPPFRLFAWLSSARDDISAPKAALYLAAHTPAGSHYSVNALAQPRLPPLYQNTVHHWAFEEGCEG